MATIGIKDNLIISNPNCSQQFIEITAIHKVFSINSFFFSKIAKLLLHGGLTEMNIDDLSNEEYATIVAILSKRENVFSIRQVRIRLKRPIIRQANCFVKRPKNRGIGGTN